MLATDDTCDEKLEDGTVLGVRVESHPELNSVCVVGGKKMEFLEKWLLKKREAVMLISIVDCRFSSFLLLLS